MTKSNPVSSDLGCMIAVQFIVGFAISWTGAFMPLWDVSRDASLAVVIVGAVLQLPAIVALAVVSYSAWKDLNHPARRSSRKATSMGGDGAGLKP